MPAPSPQGDLQVLIDDNATKIPGDNVMLHGPACHQQIPQMVTSGVIVPSKLGDTYLFSLSLALPGLIPQSGGCRILHQCQ
eukprot:13258732-Ditylum_brightwellii.AAC.2